MLVCQNEDLLVDVERTGMRCLLVSKREILS